jgi:poly(A) polymerase
MTRLSDQAWLTAPATVAVMDALEGGGGEGRFVGGCVRDALIGRPVADIDIATPMHPDRVVQAVTAAGLKAVPTGIEHGTVTVVSSGRPFEVTTLRRDVSTDGRRATVAFTDDWTEDAARRDFRLNALYADRRGAVFDPTGEGVGDAREGRIIFVGEAEQRIREDYLRILRFFRFQAWFGRGEPDNAALAACKRLRDGLAQLSAERVSAELLKLLAAPDPRGAVHIMADTGVIFEVLPWIDSPAKFLEMIAIDRDPILRLSSLLPDDPEVVREAANALRLSNAQKSRLIEALPDGTEVAPLMGERAARAALYRLGRQTFRDRLARAWAADSRLGDAARALMALADDWTRPVFPISGADLKAAGMTPSPEMGRILGDLEAWWVAEDFPDVGLEGRLAALIAEARP